MLNLNKRPLAEKVLLLLRLVGIPLFAYLIAFAYFATDTQATVAFLTLWMVFWWISESVPLFVTSCLPLFVLPLMGGVSLSSVVHSYFTDIFFLFLGDDAHLRKWSLH